jgi:hypothetical protein
MSLDEGMQAFGYRVPKLILSCNLVQGFATLQNVLPGLPIS